MKPRISLPAGRGLKWLAALLALVLMAGVVGAADRVLIPEPLNLPYYMRGLGQVDTDLVAAIVYRPVACVPKDFNLLDFYDWEFDPDCPLFVEGFAVWQSDAPIQMQLWNAPGELVPVFFFSLEDVAEAQADDFLTIDEVLAFESLVVGWADSYFEILQPNAPSTPSASWHITLSASGVLADGLTTFDLKYTDSRGGNKNAKVTFGD